MHRIYPVMLSVACAALLAGCGGEGDGDELTGDNDPAATRAAQAYVDAYADHEPRAVCELLAEEAFNGLESGGGCVKAVKASLNNARAPKASRSYVDGDEATVVFEDTPRRVLLVREGGEWKVANGGT